MPDSAAQPGSEPVVAMVGAGASATLTAVHLLRNGSRPPRVVMIDRYARHGLGQAYATTDPRHLLNACTEKMSALDGDPGHLLRWARSHGWDGEGTDYMPRALYGRYLRELLDETARDGRVSEVTGEVVGLSRDAGRWNVRLSGGEAVRADAVVLATGNRAPAAWGWAPDDPRYVADPWAPGALDRIGGGAPVLVVGTGLTMVDIATTVTERDPDTVVYAVSRHGLLPEPHRCPSPPPAEVALPDGPLALPRLMRVVRRAIEENEGEWRGVVDALRPHVPRLWEEASEPDKRRFLGLVARHWEVCRHRIPPGTADRIERLRDEGRLRIVKGRVEEVVAEDDGLVVRGAGEELRVAWLVNGTGPAGDPADDPFLRGLFDAGIARPDVLGLGLDADTGGAVVDGRGRPQERIFTLGPTLRGLRYETTAIPEIRTQAAALATRLASVLG